MDFPLYLHVSHVLLVAVTALAEPFAQKSNASCTLLAFFSAEVMPKRCVFAYAFEVEVRHEAESHALASIGCAFVDSLLSAEVFR